MKPNLLDESQGENKSRGGEGGWIENRDEKAVRLQIHAFVYKTSIANLWP